ncbi:MAG: AMP-binding protein [Gammaproteobacteria bacterium]
MNIIEILKKYAEIQPNKTALIHEDKQISYQELDCRSDLFANFLREQGVLKNHKAMLFVPLSIELYILFFALLKNGSTVVLVDPTTDKNKIAQCIEAIKPEVFIGSPKAHLLRFIKAIRDIPKKFSTNIWIPGSSLLKASKNFENSIEIAPNTPALITFTSGSTGVPKAISRSHEFLIHQHQAIVDALPFSSHHIELNTLPVFILSNLASCITTVIPDQKIKNIQSLDANKIIRQLKKNHVNRILAAPAFFKKISDYLISTQEKLNGIEKIYTGGGPVFPSLLKNVQDSFPKSEIIAVYGSTEAEPIAHIDLSQMTALDFKKMKNGHGLLAGQPISKIQLAIVPDHSSISLGPFTESEFNSLVLPPNQYGEIVVTGDHVQKSYLFGDEHKTKFKVGNAVWHRTGDAGYLDQNGRLWLAGRCSEKIRNKKKIIYPFCVEAAAMSFPEVEKAALVQMNGGSIVVIETLVLDGAKLCDKIKTKLKNIDIDTVKIVKKIPVDTRHHSKILYDDLKKILNS